MRTWQLQHSGDLRVAVLGATGYSGMEVLRYLYHHPHVTVNYVGAGTSAGQPIGSALPAFFGIYSEDIEPIDLQRIAEKADVAILCLPSGKSAAVAQALLQLGVRVIDVGGDLRLGAYDAYLHYYGKEAPLTQEAYEALIGARTFGLSEYAKEALRTAELVADPGCYPTAALLALLPLVEAGLVQPGGVIIDAASGVTGSGAKPTPATHYVTVDENYAPYKVGQHQHQPEIEEQLQRYGDVGKVTFVTHLLPAQRGILETIHVALRMPVSARELRSLYDRAYADAPFVRLLPEDVWPNLRAVAGTNLCDLNFTVDAQLQRATLFVSIDNLGKGAAGQAVQNLNLMYGFDEACGLTFLPSV
ncbi:MAG: N-acetyl-gamma-glutamyl-phosphate reductase [Firmicutes bacterium]|nr:N-acetyl-gamma-glutamyl-phosphate reductase [Bacillota bacterium]